MDTGAIPTFRAEIEHPRKKQIWKSPPSSPLPYHEIQTSLGGCSHAPLHGGDLPEVLLELCPLGSRGSHPRKGALLKNQVRSHQLGCCPLGCQEKLPIGCPVLQDAVGAHREELNLAPRRKTLSSFSVLPAFSTDQAQHQAN